MGTNAFAEPVKPLTVVQSVDINRYLGKWHEIARIPHGFQKGCKNSTAEYSLREDGDIKVLNSCEIAGKEKRKQAIGRAWVTDTNTNAKLRVQFFLTGLKLNFLSGNYWIIDLDENYNYVLVGDPSRKYLWILSRQPKLDQVTTGLIVSKAEHLGFDVSKLLFNDKITF